MLIGILEAGRPAPALAKEFGTYAEMSAHLVDDGDDMTFRNYWLPDGEFPLSVKDCDAWLITGSRDSVLAELPWMLRLEGFLREAQSIGRRVVGICFGHQILAKALGGEVIEASNGWQLGLKNYDLIARPDWLKDTPERLRLNAIHQDQVLRAPPGATVLAAALGCPIAALAYGDWAVSFQAHPEFSLSFEKALLSAYVGLSLPENVGNAALAGLDKVDAATDSSALAQGLRRFLRKNSN
jgi:GMP synthase (glutamine-hydrolysing)